MIKRKCRQRVLVPLSKCYVAFAPCVTEASALAAAAAANYIYVMSSPSGVAMQDLVPAQTYMKFFAAHIMTRNNTLN